MSDVRSAPEALIAARASAATIRRASDAAEKLVDACPDGDMPDAVAEQVHDLVGEIVDAALEMAESFEILDQACELRPAPGWLARLFGGG